MDGPGEVSRSELQATVEARRELGVDYEPALIDGFLERVEAAVQTRVDARLEDAQDDRRARDSRGGRQLTLGIVSLGTGIPITAVAGGTADLPGVIVAWVGIAAVNVAHAWQARSGRERR